MVQFTTVILKFDKQGEKTGWTYIEITPDIAEQLNPGNKKAFRVKGKLDKHAISGVSVLPMGNGNFILPVNAEMRKKTGKRQGSMLQVHLEVDTKPYELNEQLVACIEDEPVAKDFFYSLPRSVQNYYSKWIESAKTEPTREKRIVIAVTALSRRMHYPQMIKEQKLTRL